MALKARSCNFTECLKLSPEAPHTSLGRPPWCEASSYGAGAWRGLQVGWRE